ncbi:MAG: penicillin-binding protein activator LpoB [Sedimentisphaerales bacterium]
MKNLSILLFFSMLLLAGCEEVSKIDTTNDTGKQVMSLDYRDFDQAASEMIQSLLSSGVLAKKDGSRYVVATSKVTNDTMQRIDTDQLTAKIEEDLMNSGQVVMTSAVGGKESNRDETIYNMRDVRDSSKGEEFKQETLPQKGQIIAPELSLSGKIFQRNLRYDKDKQQVEYYFQLKMTDVKTGARFWQKEVLIGKRGSNKTVAW